jgi:hypothetical protein
LPPYSPELNPIERVWKLTRRLATHNRYFAYVEEVAHAVESLFEKWRVPNITLSKLCAIIETQCILYHNVNETQRHVKEYGLCLFFGIILLNLAPEDPY